ncbi:MAG TPA: polysaccharide biosynthesis C-terminal domain-containing protein [Bacteroidales bacterium]|nr:polysaccharide biosynthesis C-terminal domain-containing protein [Bacteroidales bacterium]
MKRIFFTNILLLVILNILVKAFWVLGIDRSVQNVVGAGDYGFYFSLFSFSVLFNILLDFGITNYNNRKVAADHTQLRLMIGNIFVIRLLFAVVYGIFVFGLALAIGYRGARLSLLSVLMLNQFLASFIIYLRSNIAALQLYRIDSILSVTDRFFMILVCGYLLWVRAGGSDFKIEWFVYSQSAAYLITFLLSLFIVIRKGRIFRLKYDLRGTLKIIRGSAPFALLSLFMAVYWRIDSVMLERLMSEGAISTGIYAQAFRLLDAAAMIPYLFAVILLPMFSHLMSSGQKPLQILRFSAVLVFIPAFAATVISFLYSFEIMDLLYVEHVSGSADILAILMAGYIPVSIIYIFSTYLTALGRMKVLIITTGAGMVLNLVLNYILIPEAGIRGSAFASVTVQTLMSIAFFFYVIKTEKIPVYTLSIIRLSGYVLPVIVVGLLLHRLDSNWIASSLIIIFFALVLPFLSSLLNPGEFASFFNKSGK